MEILKKLQEEVPASAQALRFLREEGGKKCRVQSIKSAELRVQSAELKNKTCRGGFYIHPRINDK